MSWLGLDIGGANIKAATSSGWAQNRPFALWREAQNLGDALSELMACAPPFEHLAITMTGELCDAFRSKAEGVRHILYAAREAAREHALVVYLVTGDFAPVDKAWAHPELAAASNWHALARYAARFTNEDAILIDVGSTTTDLIPICEGRPRTSGLNDTERLLAGELVYTGVRRTPLCALVEALPWKSDSCPVAAEWFATTADVYVLLGSLGEQPASNDTADGRPLTKDFARQRLARMLCLDTQEFSLDDAVRAAQYVKEVQTGKIRAAVQQVVARIGAPVEQVVISGEGEFLAEDVARQAFRNPEVVSLCREIGGSASQSAPAYAVAVMAMEACANEKTRTLPRKN